ncbi:MAG: hypothetical protein B7733_08560, partial [Myxococcales bacterium FL481]
MHVDPRIAELERRPWTRAEILHFLRTAESVPSPRNPARSGRHAFYMKGLPHAGWNGPEVDALTARQLARCAVVTVNAYWGGGDQRSRAEDVLERAQRLNPALLVLGYVPTNVDEKQTASGSFHAILQACPDRYR